MIWRPMEKGNLDGLVVMIDDCKANDESKEVKSENEEESKIDSAISKICLSKPSMDVTKSVGFLPKVASKSFSSIFSTEADTYRMEDNERQLL